MTDDNNLRKAIAREYAEFQDGTTHPPDWQLHNGEDFAAAVLALPEVTALCAQAAALQRVQELVKELDDDEGNKP